MSETTTTTAQHPLTAADHAEWRRARARVAALSRDRAADDPVYVAAQQHLKMTRCEIVIREMVSTAPRLAPEHLDRLALILLRGRGETNV